ncbi:hypothetical protein MKW92_040714, partial [Papaver armeniacum]
MLSTIHWQLKQIGNGRTIHWYNRRRIRVMAAKRISKFDTQVVPVSPEDVPINGNDHEFQQVRNMQQLGDTAVGIWSQPTLKRKTKVICTIGPSTDTREMIWKLAEIMPQIKKVIDLVKEYTAQSKDNVIAIMLDAKAGFLSLSFKYGPEVRSGDLPKSINLTSGQEFTFTIKSGVGTETCVGVTYDDLICFYPRQDSVKCEVVDGGHLKSRRHLNVRGFNLVHELKDYLKGCGADIHVIVKIASAVSVPNLHSIITASDGRRSWAELPIEEVPLIQEEIIRQGHNQGKAVIVARDMLESMIVHPTPTRAEVSDIAIAVREGADAGHLKGVCVLNKVDAKRGTTCLSNEKLLINEQFAVKIQSIRLSSS